MGCHRFGAALAVAARRRARDAGSDTISVRSAPRVSQYAGVKSSCCGGCGNGENILAKDTEAGVGAGEDAALECLSPLLWQSHHLPISRQNISSKGFTISTATTE